MSTVRSRPGPFAYSDNKQVTLTILLYWSMIETCLALIAACLPTLKFLVALSFIQVTLDTMRNLISTSSKSTSAVNEEVHQGIITRKSVTIRSASRSERSNPPGQSYELTGIRSKVSSDVESRRGQSAHTGV